MRVIQPNGSILLGEVIGVSDRPYSLAELSSLIESDWVFNEVLSGDYNYYIIVELDAQLQEEDMGHRPLAEHDPGLRPYSGAEQGKNHGRREL